MNAALDAVRNYCAALRSDLKAASAQRPLLALFVAVSGAVALAVSVSVSALDPAPFAGFPSALERSLWRWGGLATVLVCSSAYLSDRRAVRAGVGVALSGGWLCVCGLLALVHALAALMQPAGVARELLELPIQLLLFAFSVPFACDLIARSIERLPGARIVPGWLRSRAAVYAWLAFGVVWTTLSTVLVPLLEEARLHPGAGYRLLLALLSLLSVLHRHTLWDRSQPRWSAWLPHLPVLGFLPTETAQHGLYTFWVIGLSVGAAAGNLQQMLLRVGRRVVAVRPASRAVIHDSIQSHDTAFCDVHGFAARLVGTIERSDAGVFGLTGVRGAGKSALARRVLHVLRPDYFTLEIASPARHDPDLGFFLSVCRAVAQRVRDDLRPSFDPASGVIGLLGRSVRNGAVISLSITAALCLFLAQPGDLRGPLRPNIVMDEGDAVAWETVIMGDLQTQLAARLGKPAVDRTSALPNDSWVYMIAPAEALSSAYFVVAPIPAGADQHRVLREQMADRASWGVRPYDRPFAPRPWLRGTTRLYASEIADLVLGRDSKCRRDIAVSHLLRCAAAEGAGAEFLDSHWSVVSPSNTADVPRVGPFFTQPRLAALAERLGLYLDSLPGAIPSTSLRRLQFLGVTLTLPAPTLTAGAASTFWVCAGLLTLMIGVSLSWSPLGKLVRALANRHDLSLYRDAELFLEELSFSASREASRGLAWQGLTLGSRRTLADRALTLPGLTARYHWFVRRVCEHYNGKLVIAVDELDKVHDMAHVQNLLSDIKGALFVEGTYYIVSISEDAATSFRKRQASGRDIFESTFDEVFDVRPMDLAGAEAMLRSRLELSAPEAPSVTLDVLKIGALLAGGVPREMLRNFRALSSARCADAGAACRSLVANEIQEWIANLATSRLSGSEVIGLRDAAVNTWDAVQVGEFERAFLSLRSCLSIIDPDNLRAQVRNIAWTEGDGSGDALQARAYAALSHDIQTCLRLQLLVTIGQFLMHGVDVEELSGRTLECHAALQRKPALAEMLLMRLRGLPPTLAALSPNRQPESHSLGGRASEQRPALALGTEERGTVSSVNESETVT